jgi:hypothetical protein
VSELLASGRLAPAVATAFASDVPPFKVTKGPGQGLAGAGVRYSILVHLPKMPFSPTQPLIRPRLFPI